VAQASAVYFSAWNEYLRGYCHTWARSASQIRVVGLGADASTWHRTHPPGLRALSTPVRQAYERHVDGAVVRGLFCGIPVLIEGPGDRAVFESRFATSRSVEEWAGDEGRSGFIR
jgi:hypothetical protein